MSAARLYCKVARPNLVQSRDKSIHVVPLDEGVLYYHFNCAAAELKALGAIQDFEYTQNDGNRFLVIELSRPSLVFGTDQSDVRQLISTHGRENVVKAWDSLTLSTRQHCGW